jgi:hypothetical protein
VFFRGTALLYYRDHAGTDAQLPIVFTIGDVHPENFGVMVNSDGAPFFGVNDFDEAWAAPFSYDVKRGSVGFWIAATENGERKRDRRRVVRSFVDGYLTAMRAYSVDDRSSTFQFRLDNSPKIIRSLLKRAQTDRGQFLASMIDLKTGTFRPSRNRVPASSQVSQFQKVVDRYVKDNDLGAVVRPKSFFRVLDVARKKGSGTGSLGLDRYWVLLQGWDPDPGRSVVIELKKARRSALHGLVPVNDLTSEERRGVGAPDSHRARGSSGQRRPALRLRGHRRPELPRPRTQPVQGRDHGLRPRPRHPRRVRARVRTGARPATRPLGRGDGNHARQCRDPDPVFDRPRAVLQRRRRVRRGRGPTRLRRPPDVPPRPRQPGVPFDTGTSEVDLLLTAAADGSTPRPGRHHDRYP